MKNMAHFLILSVMLISPVRVLSSEVSIKKIHSAKDLTALFCSVWKKGDFFITTDTYWAISGASYRHLGLSSGNYLTDNAIGNIISLVPAKAGFQSNMAIGTPHIRIDNKRKLIHYSHVRPIEAEGTDGVFEMDAEAVYKEGVTFPYALTNPVFVDIDGNGRFNPPNPEKIELRESADSSKKTKAYH